MTFLGVRLRIQGFVVGGEAGLRTGSPRSSSVSQPVGLCGGPVEGRQLAAQFPSSVKVQTPRSPRFASMDAAGPALGRGRFAGPGR